MTFFRMCDEFLEKHARVNKKSWGDDVVILKKLKDFFGDVPLIVSFRQARVIPPRPGFLPSAWRQARG